MAHTPDGGPVKGTVTIERQGFDRKPFSEDIEADIYGCFAVHPSPGFMLSDDDYTLTHIPTGYAYLSMIPKAKAEAAVREILAGPLDWSLIRSTKDLTATHKAQGKTMRKKYETWS